jgi:4-carboxymuconolactone decarboxylase
VRLATRTKALFGVPGIVEMTALSGYYGLVSMTLLAHEMPLPDDVQPMLKPRVR